MTELPPPPPIADAPLPGLPPPPESPSRPRAGKAGRKGRPPFAAVILAAVGFGAFRQAAEHIAQSRFGSGGAWLVSLVGVALLLAWRAWDRQRQRRRGGEEFTPEMVQRQLLDADLGPPAFQEDGTLGGASLLVMNQRMKLLEVYTEYELFGSGGARLGVIRQISQSKWKRVFRVITAFDQYFTHHFEIVDAEGNIVLRLTRPAKIFLSRLHVFDDQDRFLGTIRQENVFWKIRFTLTDPAGNVAGRLHAKNVRAWDFHVTDAYGREVATVVKSWEGWARTAFTRADRYVVRIHEPLPYGMRQLVFTAALMVDVALKQDARSFG